jgi:hypothetical protein
MGTILKSFFVCGINPSKGHVFSEILNWKLKKPSKDGMTLVSEYFSEDEGDRNSCEIW